MLDNARKKGFAAHTPWDRARILLEAVQEKLWVPDPVGTEFIQGAHLTACTDPNSPCFQGGDCDDLVVLLASAFLGVGLDTLIVGHGYGNERQIGHVLTAVHVDGKWHYADPSPIGGNSTEYAPLGKCVPFSRERLYSLPNEKMICDENACLVPGRVFNPATFIEKGHFIGVTGSPPEFAYRVQWLEGASTREVQWLPDPAGFLGQSESEEEQHPTLATKKELSTVEKILLASVVISAVSLGVNLWKMSKGNENAGTSDTE